MFVTDPVSRGTWGINYQGASIGRGGKRNYNLTDKVLSLLTIDKVSSVLLYTKHGLLCLVNSEVPLKSCVFLIFPSSGRKVCVPEEKRRRKNARNSGQCVLPTMPNLC
jgi:hypothetical protein